MVMADGHNGSASEGFGRELGRVLADRLCALALLSTSDCIDLQLGRGNCAYPCKRSPF